MVGDDQRLDRVPRIAVQVSSSIAGLRKGKAKERWSHLEPIGTRLVKIRTELWYERWYEQIRLLSELTKCLISMVAGEGLEPPTPGL